MSQATTAAGFDAITPMETPMTAGQKRALLARFAGKPYIVLAADRTQTIRRDDILPLPWADWSPGDGFAGQAAKGEWYPFQLAVYAARRAVEHVSLTFSSLVGPGRREIPASAMRCINLGGIDWARRAFTKDVSVPRGKVQALWIGVDVPRSLAAGEYRGTVTVGARGLPAAKVPVALTVVGPAVTDGGVGDMDRLARLRWLDSTLAGGDALTRPYTPLRVRGEVISCLGREVALGWEGLPAGIVSYFTGSVTGIEGRGRDILQHSVRLAVMKGDRRLQWQGDLIRFTHKRAGAVTWEGTCWTPGLRQKLQGRMEFDGTLQYRITLRATSEVTVDDIVLQLPFDTDVAKYLMGLGQKGGRRPASLQWRWDREKHQDSVWIGDVNAGLRCKLYGDDYVRPVINAHYRYGKLNLPACWHNGGRGGIRLTEEGSTTTLHTFSGRRKLKAGEEVTFCFDLQITPTRPIEPAERWRQRYFHAFKPVAEVQASGANIINLHHANDLNPFINYPLFPQPVERLKEYVQQAHEAGLKVKIYYTMRELTNHLPELWALRSLGSEVLLDGDGLGFWVKDASAMEAWCATHLRTGYRPAWRHVFTDGEYSGQTDASLLTASRSRWCNFYLEGLDWLCRRVKIDGLYIDDVCYDRTVMQRVRRILDRRRPGALIDMHSWNHVHGAAGFINSALLYMELMPYLDSLWYGEAFDYNEGPDYWLIEMAGIPYGRMGEMLQNNGNPWRGMLYGMSQRLPWSGDPRSLWRLWDEFDIEAAEMIGYWDDACPVRTDHEEVLATVYRRKERTLVCLASWAAGPVAVDLAIDWAALGINPDRATLTAPAIAGLQEEARFKPSQDLTVEPGKGWMLIVR